MASTEVSTNRGRYRQKSRSRAVTPEKKTCSMTPEAVGTAIVGAGFTDQQIYAEISGLLAV